jgi:hypothetical protein
MAVPAAGSICSNDTCSAIGGAADETLHEYRDVTPLGWGERSHDQGFASKPAMRLIAERGDICRLRRGCTYPWA